MAMLIRGVPPVGERLQKSLLQLGSDLATPGPAIDLSGSQRGAPQIALDLEALSRPNTLCELELSDGAMVWLRPDELAQSAYFEVATQRDGLTELVPRRRSQRGLGDAVVSVLKLFNVDPAEIAVGASVEAATGLVADAAREKLLARLEKDVQAGVYRVGDAPSDLFEFDSAQLQVDKPVLLLLHGTFSSAVGSFGGLHSAGKGQRWQALVDAYGRQIIALEHRTLSVSPLRNALDIAEALPAGGRLHVLSHSRGGLIGELLARTHDGIAGFSPTALHAFDNRDEQEAELLHQLDAVLRRKAFRVERFVRVACPARGTTLASERGRDWLTVAANLLFRLLKTGVDSGLGAAGMAALVPVARGIVELLQAVTLRAVDTAQIPGLHAMDPASDFQRRLINAEDARASGRLTVIAGDAEASGLVGRLKLFAIDRFFERDNDMVVDTASMIGGAQRTQVYRHLARSADVNHFTYFSNPPTSELIVTGLTADQLDGHPQLSATVIEQSPLRTPLLTPPLRSGRTDAPIVFLLPGIMGTHLKVDGELVWVDKWGLVRGGFARLGIDTAGVEAAHLDGDTYQSLADALAADHEVVPFPYDWRLAISDSARKLNTEVRKRLEQAAAAKRPIRFVAHSMGGLVVRAMKEVENSVWDQVFAHPESRFVMLGTPNQGSHAISLLLTGKDKLVNMLALLDMKNSLQDIVGWATRFPGGLDMAPTTGERDYFTEDAWAELAGTKQQPQRWPLPTQSDLDASRAFRLRLAEQDLGNGKIFYVAGQAKETPIEARVTQAGGKPRLSFLGTHLGDGRVPWATGIPEGVKAWYVPAKHGDIPAYRGLHAGLRDILNSGETQRLQDQPPISRALADDRFEYTVDDVNYLPDSADLMQAAQHSDAEQEIVTDLPLPPVQLKVIWGNLRYSRDPVVVGHYIGDGIVSAEKALDRFLDGALTRRLALGGYPGELGTALMIPNARGDLPGAIVLGLGQVSMRMTRNQLRRAVEAGTCEWVARVLETKDSGTDESPLAQRGLAFVAIGSGAGGMSIADVGIAILDGVERTLQLLRSKRGLEEVRRLNLHHVHFLELYEERAHTLWHGLSAQLARRRQNGARDSCFHFARGDDRVHLGKGGRRRLVMDDDAGWWSPLKITEDGSRLVFENVGDRARSELHGVGTHAGQIDALLADAITSRHTSNDLLAALFEMLLPNDLKDSLPNGDRLRLLVDSSSAHYPWEMILAGARGGNDESQRGVGSVALSVVRQFTTDRFRSRPQMSKSVAALVIGDPIALEGGFVELPGALAEAYRVHAHLTALRHRMPYAVLRSANQILIGLYAAPYQIVHFAGHGIDSLRDWLASRLKQQELSHRSTTPGCAVPENDSRDSERKRLQMLLDETENKSYSAMVIGPDAFLTHRNIQQMRHVPELVFINCCHLGAIPKTGPATQQLGSRQAANFAESFIELGVHAVVAAGWPVDDAAASTFAEAFYSGFCAGATFGDAVSEARTQTRQQHPDSNTWAAYQCYGDPSYRYSGVRSDDSASGSGADRRYGSPRHLAWEGIHGVGTIEALRDLCAKAGTDGFDTDGELCTEIADAFRGFKSFDEAIFWYRRAIASENGSMALRGIEQLVNLLARSAPDAGAVEPELKDWSKQVDAGLDLLRHLNAQNPTQERWALIASAAKRKAKALKGNRRKAALKDSAEAYRAAAEISRSTSPTGNPYAFINAAVMLAASDWTSGETLPSRDIRRLSGEAESRAKDIDPKDFWDFVIEADLLVMQLFACLRKPTPAKLKRIEQIYLDAYLRDGSKGNLASVLDQFVFIAESLRPPANSAIDQRAHDIRDALASIESAIRILLD